MSRINNLDIVQELLVKCSELEQHIMQQLKYYRASVYKDEVANKIYQEVERLRAIVSLIGHEEAIDCFQDFEATRCTGNMKLSPGECHLTWRLTTLFSGIRKAHEDKFSIHDNSYDSHETKREELLTIA